MEALSIARSIKNLDYFISVNMECRDSTLIYSDDYTIYAPFCNTILDCDSEEEIYVYKIKLDKLEVEVLPKNWTGG